MLVIRKEIPEDYSAVRKILEESFRTPGEANLVDELRNSAQAVVLLVAEEDGEVIGHILFSPVSIKECPSVKSGLGLGPVAVREKCRNKGVGAKLILEGIGECEKRDFKFIVLLGSPVYYSRFGFKRARDFGLDNEYGAVDAFMVLELEEGCLDGVSGLIKYSDLSLNSNYKAKTGTVSRETKEVNHLV